MRDKVAAALNVPKSALELSMGMSSDYDLAVPFPFSSLPFLSPPSLSILIFLLFISCHILKKFRLADLFLRVTDDPWRDQRPSWLHHFW